MTCDLFHIGHLRAIRQCAKIGTLTVGLLNAPEYKKTIIPFEQRKEILEAIPEVDKVIEQKGLKMDLKGYDYVASGDGFEKEELETIKKHNCQPINISYCQEQSTTKIKQKIWNTKK